ncbi:dephospho-CoA kinase/protein folding accessory domain-containing protein [Chlamydia abortus]|uniref:GrpB family protein n=1 Tax=Paenibacillus sp. 32O-W TaxID=1695218 RepID=UPI000A27D831|nr:GrpB family protein [Paenibacillus sp. 32O-W]SHE15107.1 dephospho-CoA kinase/protein folding accessory domain-containing protein [Chlamydia abortus]
MGSNSSVVVVPYDPDWVQLFEKLREFVLPVVSDLIVTIEHAGSTSVPGLAAKPIVDMDVIVPSQADVHIAIQRLSTLGYIHEGDLGIAGREAFIPPDHLPRHHLYVCTQENDEYKRHILFRDYLRSHPDDSEKYGELKLELAQRFHNDRKAYTNAKSEFVEQILQRAGWNS